MPNYFNQFPTFQPNYFQGANSQPNQNQASPGVVYPSPSPQQSTGMVPVTSEEVARNYPVSYGSTVIFKDENNSKIYIKTMGYSQLESPVFERYLKEDTKTANGDSQEPERSHTSYDELKSEVEALRGEVDTLKERLASKTKVKKEADDDE